MAKAYIAEYDRQARDPIGIVPTGQEPAIANQTVVIGAEAKSAAFAATTQFVAVSVDAICSVAFGAAPTSTTSSLRLPANSITYFGVVPGHKISVISNS